MIRRLFFLCLFLAVAGGLGGRATAQQQSLPVSVQVSLGFRNGGGGTYHHRGGAAVDLLIGMPMRESTAGTLVGGIVIGAQSPMAVTDDCLVIRGTNECAPNFPIFFSGGLLAGVQRGAADWFSARALAGPVYYQAHSTDGGGGALGLQGRLEFATPTLLHTAPTISIRSSLVPRFAGETLRITEVAIGLRVQ
jgi:hypothetical protein